ncbi:GL19919 [Drosophila persimilis]|uniref:GL19919 n=1 Tax=Drosophila persimilis TaxID=7234 RepID=B4H6C4_DROPE|nr:GL19919 [Drosophila persimilis]
MSCQLVDNSPCSDAVERTGGSRQAAGGRRRGVADIKCRGIYRPTHIVKICQLGATPKHQPKRWPPRASLSHFQVRQKGAKDPKTDACTACLTRWRPNELSAPTGQEQPQDFLTSRTSMHQGVMAPPREKHP